MTPRANIEAESYFPERELHERYGIPARTAQRWRVTGDGPPWVRIGARRIMYRKRDVEAWLEARTFQSRAAELAAKTAAE